MAKSVRSIDDVWGLPWSNSRAPTQEHGRSAQFVPERLPYDSRMIHLSVRRLKPEMRESVERWLAEVSGPLRSEAIETLRAEGVTHETALILDTSDGPVIVYAMETDDIDQARAVGAASTRPIDQRHHEVMRAADDGPAPHHLVLNVS